MLKIRITYNNEAEKDRVIDIIKNQFDVLNISKEYKGRGDSEYSNVYIDAELDILNLL